MKKQLLVIGVTMAGLVACAQKDMTAAQEAVQEGHGYTSKGYVHPRESEVRERLEWFKDQKLGLMMHWGLYSVIGIKESWGLCDAKEWARREVTWTNDGDEVKGRVVVYPGKVKEVKQ